MSITELKQKQKLSKQLEQEQNHRNKDHLEGYQQEEGGGKMGQMVQGISSINSRYKIDGEVKNSIGNGEAKELICTNHGHELRVCVWGECWRVRGIQGRGE